MILDASGFISQIAIKKTNLFIASGIVEIKLLKFMLEM